MQIVKIVSFFQLVFCSVLPVLAQGEPVSNNLNKLVKIAWIGPLTGDAAFLGLDSVNVLKTEIEKINSSSAKQTKFKLLVSDDQYNTSKAISAYKKFREYDDVKIFFIITYGAVVSISQMAKKEDVIIIDTLDCDDEIAALSENTFCIAKRTESIGENLAQLAMGNGVKAPSFIYSQEDPFLPKVAGAAIKEFSKNGIKPASKDAFSEPISDFKSVLLKSKKLKSDALFIFGYDDYGLALKQARQLGMKQSLYSLASAATPGFQKLAGSAVNGMYGVGWHAPRTKAFEDFSAEYQKNFGRRLLLEISSVPSFDAIYILEKLMEEQRLAGLDRRADLNIPDLQKRLYTVKDYQGLSGNITIEEDGAVRSFTVNKLQFKNGEFKKIDPK